MIRNRQHAARVVERIERMRPKPITDERHAPIAWLGYVATSPRYSPADNSNAAEIRLALLGTGYRPTPAAIAWLNKQAKRSARFVSARWARWAIRELEERT